MTLIVYVVVTGLVATGLFFGIRYFGSRVHSVSRFAIDHLSG